MLHKDSEAPYPSSDGLPMADKDVGRTQMEDIEFALSRWFKRDPGVYVSANLLLYYKKGTQARVAPDVFLVRDVGNHPRDTYRLWDEGRPPDIVFEFTSRSSKHLDPNQKVSIYKQMGVPEIYLFDPEGRWLKPRFKSICKVGDDYVELHALHARTSPILGLELRIEDDWLRLYDLKTGQRLPTAHEEADRADQATRRVAELEEELRRLRGDAGSPPQ